MSRLAPLLGLVVTVGAGGASAKVSPYADEVPLDLVLRHSDYVPTAAALAATPLLPLAPLPDPAERMFFADGPGEGEGSGAPVAPDRRRPGPGMELAGEVLVMEGDDEIVTTFGPGQYGLVFNTAVANPLSIVTRFLEIYPDEFDFVTVWTSFWDFGAEGLAYYVGIRQTDSGIGQPMTDNGWLWGSGAGGRLQGFLNMKAINLYGNIAEPGNYVYPVMGQEMSHRWLAFMHFETPSGQVSNAMLGRDASHWSSLLQAYGSVQDGMFWQDNADGTFQAIGKMSGYSPLDLYGMGFLAPEEVPPWYLITKATYKGQQLNGHMQFDPGITIKGEKLEIGIEDVVAVHGARSPDHLESRKDFRMAVILVTEPGQEASQVEDEIETIQQWRTLWEAKFESWTGGRARVCTRISAPCDFPLLEVSAYAVREAKGDGDGMPEPGETVAVDLEVANSGGSDAVGVTATAALPEAADLTAVSPSGSIADVPAGEKVAATGVLEIEVGKSQACGVEVTVPVTIADEKTSTTVKVSFPVGFLDLHVDDLDGGASAWIVNAEGKDTAALGVWEHAVPQGVDAGHLGVDVVTQPQGDRSGTGKAFVTGAKGGGELGEDDLDDGYTTLWSPSWDVRDAKDPFISYWSWRMGLDFNSRPGYVVADDHDILRVQISPDGGTTWILVEEDFSNEQAWLQKTWRVLDFVDFLPKDLRLRFTAMDKSPQSLSEAAVDELRIYDLQPTCYGIFPEDEPPLETGDVTSPGADRADPDSGGPAQVLEGGAGGASSGGCEGGGPAGRTASGLAFALLVLLAASLANASCARR